MKMVYIITGASGFLGNTVLKKLLAAGHEVRALLLPGDRAPSLDGASCKIYYGDITQIGTLRDIFRTTGEQELTVIHCAALVYIKSKFDPRVFSVNVFGTGNIIKMCIETGARLIYVNTAHAIPEPDDDRSIVETKNFSQDLVVGVYAKSKAEAAWLVLDAVKHRGLRAVILHPSGIIGPGDYGVTHMTALMLAAMRGRLPAIVKGGYDFVDVRDVADGILSAAEKGRDGECYILSNRYVSIKEMVDVVCRHSGAKRVKLTLPMPVVRLVAPLFEAYYTAKKQVPLFTRYSLYTLRSKSNFSHKKADCELGYCTRSLDETISDTVKWLAPVI